MPRTRWLWAAALLVLCMSVADAAFGADSWNVLEKTLPSEMTWDQGSVASVKAGNNGDTTWDTTFALKSVQGATAAAFTIDRWGTTTVPVTSTVAPGASFPFSFGITAPPISTLAYTLPLTPTTPPEITALANNWMLAKGAPLIRTDTASQDTTIERFPDMLPSTGESWAAPFVEELAGHVPLFVAGFPGGTYAPLLPVTRDQMAVFVARAVANGDQNVPTGPANPKFPDVPPTFWAYKWVEFAVDKDIVKGFPDGTYQPLLEVTRDQMAVFVARGVAGGDSKVPPGPAKNTFPDVPTDFWAFKYIEFAVDKDIVKGFPDGTYGPLLTVTRDQMAVFIYHAFVMPTGAAVVLAGPAITRLDPVPTTYDGWSDLLTATSGEVGNAYVGFDAARLVPEMGPITVVFDLRADGAATAAITDTETVSAGDITAAKAAVGVDGVPYFYVTADIDTSLLVPGDYVLSVFVNGNKVARTFRLTVQ